jgi:hypothetical protein
LCVVLLFWLLRPYDSVTFTPFTTDKTEYRAGEIVTMTNTFCWDGTPFAAERFIVSSVSKVGLGTVAFPWGYARADVAERYASGCSPTTIRVEIPPTTPPGDYRITYEVTYVPNPVRRVSESNTSNIFTVTAKEPSSAP